jgi:predicted nucleic acid-binding protein
MSVIVDTPIWSECFRRKRPRAHVNETFVGILTKGDALLIGPIRQEVLSGIKNEDQFAKLKDRLRVFPNVPIEQIDYEKAAEFSNLCSQKGVQGSNVDFLICALAVRLKSAIYSLDRDFENYSKILPIRLFAP